MDTLGKFSAILQGRQSVSFSASEKRSTLKTKNWLQRGAVNLHKIPNPIFCET